FVISSLTGFVNPFKETVFDIKTAFNIYKEMHKYDLITSQGEFFEKSDFELADVYINGEFDGMGGFVGKVRIYDQIVDYVYLNPRKKDSRSFYGNVPMELGYSQGNRNESIQDEFSFNKISNKVKNYGGLY